MAQSPAERRAAQRKIAKQIKTGTYEKTSIGRKAREIATRDRERIVADVNKLKRARFSGQPKWSTNGSNRATRRHADGSIRTITELKQLKKALLAHKNYDDDDLEDGVADGLYYH